MTRPADGRLPARVAETWDVLVASDPGLLRLRLGVRAVVAVLLVVAVEPFVARLVGIPTIVATLLGGMVAMNGSFATSSRAPRDAVRTAALFPVAVLAGVLPACLSVGHHEAVLAGFVVAMVAAVYVRRFGPRWFMYGMLAWFAYFFTVFVGFRLAQLLDVLAIVGAATACVAVAAGLLVPDRPDRMLAAAIRAFDLRVAALTAASRDALIGRLAPQRIERTLHGRSFRVVEAALVIDGYLADVQGGDGWAASVRHALLDAELAAEELAAVAGYLATAPDVPPDARAGLAAGLDAVRRHEHEAAAEAADLLERAAVAAPDAGASDETGCRLLDAAAVLRLFDEALHACLPEAPPHVGAYQPAVTLFLGNLPGAIGSASAALAERTSWWSRWSVNTRMCVIAAVAGSLTVAAGDLLSPTRFYWAVLACFLTLTGTFTTGEIVVKGGSRVVGTVAGLLTAAVAVHVTGRHDGAVVAVMVMCVFLGLYFFRVFYAVMAFAVTTIMGLLYNVLREFTDQLLLLRLAETVLGCGIAIAVALVVLPLRTGDVREAARQEFVDELAGLLADVRDRLAGEEKSADLLLDIRRLDARLHQLALVARPAGGATLIGLTGRRATAMLQRYTEAAYRARALAVTVADLEPGHHPALAAACEELRGRLLGGEPVAVHVVCEGDPAHRRICRLLGDLAVAVAGVAAGTGRPGLREAAAGRSMDA